MSDELTTQEQVARIQEQMAVFARQIVEAWSGIEAVLNDASRSLQRLDEDRRKHQVPFWAQNPTKTRRKR